MLTYPLLLKSMRKNHYWKKKKKCPKPAYLFHSIELNWGQVLCMSEEVFIWGGESRFLCKAPSFPNDFGKIKGKDWNRKSAAVSFSGTLNRNSVQNVSWTI